MTKKTKIQYLRIALNLAGIGIDDKTTDMVIRTYEMIEKKKGSFSVRDSAKIQADIQRQYEKPSPTNKQQ